METITSKLNNSAMSGYLPDFKPSHFFFERNNFLKDYNFSMPPLHKFAGDIINHYCKAYNLNQKIIIVTLQREMGLIEDLGKPRTTSPTDMKLLDWACGCGWYDDGTQIQKYKGFEKQIEGACATYRRWYDGYVVGVVKEILDKDMKACIAGSPITYSLLAYTPHIAALHLTEKVWERYFTA